MKSVQKYEIYSAIALATDPAFVAWVKCPDEQSNAFWTEYIRRYPGQQSTVEKARTIVNKMQVKQEKMKDERVDQTWNKIEERIKLLPGESNPSKVLSIRTWLSAAAVLLVVALGGYFFLRQTSEKSIATNTGKKQEQLYDASPGGDHAVLTLADGRKISLDSAANGDLSLQGGTKVIKVGGNWYTM
jgi:transmembrane sensor